MRENKLLNNHMVKFIRVMVLISLISTFSKSQLFAEKHQQSNRISISGKVTDAFDDQPIPGVNVLIVGTSTGTTTDVDGVYELSVNKGDSLSFSFIGYRKQEIKVDDVRIINIRLSEHTEMLKEAVVVAFGKQSKESVVSSITTVNTKDLKREETELTKFNKKYNFYASNKTFFYQFMTPLMIEKLSEFYEEFKGKVSFALINNEFHIAINDNSDFLKIDIKSEINEANIIKLKEEVISIITIIEHFELNSKQFN